MLSHNDESLYEHVKTQLDAEYVQKVETVIEKYEKRLRLFDRTNAKKHRVHNAIIAKIEKHIDELRMQYPQDIALPPKANVMYLKLELIKLELMQVVL